MNNIDLQEALKELAPLLEWYGEQIATGGALKRAIAAIERAMVPAAAAIVTEHERSVQSENETLYTV